MANILVADDDPLNLTLACEILKQSGHQAQQASCGEAVVQLAMQQPPPDLIVLDIMMPGLGGIGALHELRGEERTRDIPIVALTAMAMTNDYKRLIELGFDAYVSKPFKVEEFVAQVQTLLDRRGDNDEL
ncbi:response regulator [Ghiorsea bivora]|uniref:response regulator n=1 Tax=Ghiorsea bivora TaxID=1485545 RepID=UPI00056F420B|nr:response regulator [Ghiorsea bivora]